MVTNRRRRSGHYMGLIPGWLARLTSPTELYDRLVGCQADFQIPHMEWSTPMKAVERSKNCGFAVFRSMLLCRACVSALNPPHGGRILWTGQI